MDDLFKSFLEYIQNANVPADYSRYCIYFVECNGVFKIGTTSNIKSRLSTMQTSNPTPIRLVHTIPVPITYDHGEVERALHTIFESTYIRGEWYKINEQDIERIKLVSIDDILNIAQKMQSEKSSPQKPDNQMTLDFFDEGNF